MLVLTRKVGERIFVGDDAKIVVSVLGIKGGQIKLGIDAPSHVTVHREEIYNLIKQPAAAEESSN